MSNPKYSVIATQPWMYINELGTTVKGFRVYFRINAYNETHFIEMPSLDPETIKAKIDKAVIARDALAQL